MKIGILTLPFNTNYGGILQAFALQTVLKRMGHEVQFIQPNPYRKITFFTYVRICCRFLQKYVLGRQIEVLAEHCHNRIFPLNNKFTRRFVEENLNLREIVKFTEIESTEFDGFIVGSDQIWRSFYFKGLFLNNDMSLAYLSFTKGWNVKRISYAASFGTDHWEYDEHDTAICSSALAKFDYVSVREDSAINLCGKYLDRNDVVRLIDPTMLLGVEDYRSLYSNHDYSPNGNLMTYILDKDKWKSHLIETISKKKHLTPFETNDVSDAEVANSDGGVVQPPVENWLLSFDKSSFVITDSFHACVFSIIYQKPFVVLANPTRGISRIQSLLDMFGLQNHLITCESDYNDDIDYSSIIPLEILEKEKRMAYDFLYKALL